MRKAASTLPAAREAPSRPVPETLIKQLAAAITSLGAASAALAAAADRLDHPPRPAKSRLRRALEVTIGLLVADEALSLLAATNPVAATALEVLQSALTLTLGLGPVSVVADGLLLGAYAVHSYQASGQTPGWLDAARRFAEAAHGLWERVRPDRSDGVGRPESRVQATTRPPAPDVEVVGPPEESVPGVGSGRCVERARLTATTAGSARLPVRETYGLGW
jgi:hypothetical protein